MTTMVGTQKSFLDALIELVELEYDAVEAYKEAIEHLKREDYKEKLKNFLMDHERHIVELTNLITERGETPPKAPDIKQYLLKGKIKAANILGDNSILKAMKDNEEDTNKAYERLNNHVDKWAEAVDVLQRNFSDEKRHKAWLEETL
jgi:rubrerythrin